MARRSSRVELRCFRLLHLKTISVLAFVVISLFVFSGRGHTATDRQAQALGQVRDEARRGNYRLIAPETIKAQFLKNPTSLLLVDTRQEWEYQREYIKDAVNLPVTRRWWIQYSPWVRSEMQKTLGPDKERYIVFY
jgi:hypothetical protein